MAMAPFRDGGNSIEVERLFESELTGSSYSARRKLGNRNNHACLVARRTQKSHLLLGTPGSLIGIQSVPTPFSTWQQQTLADRRQR